ncbi:MAG: bifunctional methylenetetrahydrofolate dehydrogenase/methenyltetrahydrofolate cyclohydrolase FolD [Victivallaceae bacterium]|nr:bifunctional methylenetetrahydrofolate dehydrogenase/methenyltetrahydrofolate cyclohydrolase FolD [Victivallaceae bacterium]
MPAKIIDGKAIAASINEETKREVEIFRSKYGRAPALAVILVGDDPASQVYVRNKIRTCAEVGIRSEGIPMAADTPEAALLDKIAELNADDTIDGILVQSPVPETIDEARVIRAIDPAKDVDCFCESNVGKLLIGGERGLMPCTPFGVLELLRRSGVSCRGKDVVVIGRSNIVGKPMAALLMQKAPDADATVTVVHSATEHLAEHIARADIVIAAIGKPRFVKGAMLKKGAVVIDVGINRIFDEKTGKNRLVGDVDFDEALPVAGAITPVPGGVGPMTIAMLMRNAVTAANLRRRDADAAEKK